jgi:hypothetical protein
MRYDSLREIIIGMLSEATKISHLGIDYMVKRSTLSEANNHRCSEFFSQVYQSLYSHHKSVLAHTNNLFYKLNSFLIVTASNPLFCI